MNERKKEWMQEKKKFVEVGRGKSILYALYSLTSYLFFFL